jgi:hypothetical protein
LLWRIDPSLVVVTAQGEKRLGDVPWIEWMGYRQTPSGSQFIHRRSKSSIPP